jgi:sigma-B regulation protein RsbU (phosphoserine phosphatase)
MFCTVCGTEVRSLQKFCATCGTALPASRSDSGPRQAAVSPRPSGPSRLRTFWRRVSDGIELHQLWAQFQSEARVSQLYSKEVSWQRAEGESRGKRLRRVTQGMFWAMMMKLSPGRRVLLLIALILFLWPGFEVTYDNAHFSMPNLAFFGGIALLILLALELADRVAMKRDLEIAREIQSWLMPSGPPKVPGIDIAFATRPANTVAGDYYDVFFRHDAECNPQSNPVERNNPLILVVADVAGKSVPAALLMATLQASLRTLAALTTCPVELVKRLNEYACAQNLGRQRFTTAFLGQLDPVSGRLDYVNAGHNWPVLWRGSGAMERLDAGGLPLGIKRDAPYECGSTTLARGDLLLIFTDGLIEAENSKEEEYGEGRMLERSGDLRNGTAAEVLSGIMTSIDGFVGTAPQHDDITCLVLRIISTNSHA